MTWKRVDRIITMGLLGAAGLCWIHYIYGTIFGLVFGVWAGTRGSVKTNKCKKGESPSEAAPDKMNKQSNNRAMWKLETLRDWDTQAQIRDKWVPARPENYKPAYCPIGKRLLFAWQVIRGRAETFVWPEGQ